MTEGTMPTARRHLSISSQHLNNSLPFTSNSPLPTDNMNWTGGRLQRHQKNAGGGVASRQKQHFAKVRSQLQNGSRPGHVPFRPSFLQEDYLTLGGILPPFSERSSRHVGHSKKHRRGSKRNRTGGSSEDDGSERRDHTVSPTVGPVTGVPDRECSLDKLHSLLLSTGQQLTRSRRQHEKGKSDDEATSFSCAARG
jgi:hypothetical protein